MTATFTITLDGNFLGMQLIDGGKTEKVYQGINFLKISINPKHYNNEMESMTFINEILIPYVDLEREKLNVPNQKPLVVFDVFRGQLKKKRFETSGL